MAKTYALTFSGDRADAVAKKLQGLTGKAIAQTIVGAINEVGDRTYELSRDRITVGINLTDEYLRRRFTVKPATEARPKFTITAHGSRDDLTPLSRYGVQMQLVPKKLPRSRGRGLLPIPAGQKQRAVTVEVTRGQPATLLYGFMLPLRGGNGLGVFTRSRDGTRRHRYGPSVYQLFRYQADRIEDDVLDDMDQTLTAAAEKAMKDALE